MLIGSAIFVVALGLGLVATVRQARIAHEPDDRPSDLALLGAIVRKPMFLVMVAVFPVATAIAGASGGVAGVLASVAIVAGLVVGARDAMQNRGIEREQLLMASAIAFLATAAVCGVWSMFEVFADAPLISMRVPWTVGIVVLVGSLAIQRRRAA